MRYTNPVLSTFPAKDGDTFTDSDELLFWSLIDRSGDGCWEWQGGRNALGYGRFQRDWARKRGSVRVHRLTWILLYGAIPNGFVVMHRCDNPPCCNPIHLRLGTKADNSADMKKKGRSTVGYLRRDNCINGHPLEGDNLKIKIKRTRSGDYLTRNCRICEREHQNRRRAARRGTAGR